MKSGWPVNLLTLCPPRISENSINIKINLDYFLTSLWRLKRFYEGLQSFHKTFWGTAKKCENKYLSLFSLFVRIRMGKINSIRHFVSKPSAFAHLIFYSVILELVYFFICYLVSHLFLYSLLGHMKITVLFTNLCQYCIYSWGCNFVWK